ncbi:MAG: hypothetical protein ACOY4U_11050 [Pseudomonadota bacterium]
MSLRELAGLLLLAAAAITAPFGYWLSFQWVLVTLALGLPGVWLYASARVMRKAADTGASAADLPPGSELRGFHGADLFDHDD